MSRRDQASRALSIHLSIPHYLFLPSLFFFLPPPPSPFSESPDDALHIDLIGQADSYQQFVLFLSLSSCFSGGTDDATYLVLDGRHEISSASQSQPSSHEVFGCRRNDGLICWKKALNHSFVLKRAFVLNHSFVLKQSPYCPVSD